MSSTIIQPIADQLKTLLEGLDLPKRLKVPPSGWARDHLDSVPAAEIEPPDLRRVDPDTGESQLGSDDWDLEFLVSIWFDLREPTSAQKDLVEAVEKWIAAVDANRSLGGTVLDASVISANRVYQLDANRALAGYETTVGVLKLVSY